MAISELNGAEPVLSVAATLGEGPVWQSSSRSLFFVDIKQPAVHQFTPHNRQHRQWTTPEQVGFVLPCQSGRWLLGLQSGLCRFDSKKNAFSMLALVDSDRVNNRINDGFVDRTGRVWFGTMDDLETKKNGRLLSFAQREVTVHDDGIAITNGPCMSPQGDYFYHTDTLAKIIYRYRVNAEGQLSHKELFIRMADDWGYPDGTTVDAEGCLWVCLWGGWGALRISPSGEPLLRVRLPVANVTKVAFGGDDRQTLFFTTARKGMSENELQQQPLAGHVFALSSAFQGLPQYEVEGV